MPKRAMKTLLAAREGMYSKMLCLMLQIARVQSFRLDILLWTWKTEAATGRDLCSFFVVKQWFCFLVSSGRRLVRSSRCRYKRFTPENESRMIFRPLGSRFSMLASRGSVCASFSECGGMRGAVHKGPLSRKIPFSALQHNVAAASSNSKDSRLWLRFICGIIIDLRHFAWV